MKMLSTKLPLLIFTLWLGTLQATFANEQEFFSEGKVLIYCSVPDGDKQISQATFELAFPKWVENLQKHAHSGTVIRAHYLGDLKSGIAILVTGGDKKEALSNAGKIFVEQGTILREAVIKTNSAFPFINSECQFLKIGPLIVMSDKDKN